MAKYRNSLPHLEGGLYLSDGGLETSLIYHDGIELPHFAAFTLLRSAAGRAALRRYFRTYLEIAAERGTGFILDTATWRANPDWAVKLDIGPAELDALNRDAVAFALALRDEFEVSRGQPVIVNGVVGPRGDGYRVDHAMSIEEARLYHSLQIASLRRGGADMVSATTMTYAEEAAGIALAARDQGMPVVISFTVETDGRLPSGMGMGEAIDTIDKWSGIAPLYYMINCAHPEHFERALGENALWLKRIHGVRANASTRSHAELDAATTLDAGDPQALGEHYRALRRSLPEMNVLGGCCGTDHRHIAAIVEAVQPAA